MDMTEGDKTIYILKSYDVTGHYHNLSAYSDFNYARYIKRSLEKEQQTYLPSFQRSYEIQAVRLVTDTIEDVVK